MVNPPEGHPCQPRRFEQSSVNVAVRRACEQAAAQQEVAADSGLSPGAALAALMAMIETSGVVADAADPCTAPAMPDGAC